MEMTFRNAAFGGFHRQDVMDYIAATAKENGEKIAALEEEVRSLQEAMAENQRLKKALEASEAALKEKSEQVEALVSEKNTLLEKCSDRDILLAENSAMAGKVQEYSDLKQHITGIELDAHKRADTLIAEAQEQSEEIIRLARERQDEIRKHIKEELAVITKEYEAVVRTYEVVSTNITGELRKIDVSLNGMPGVFQRMTSALEDLAIFAED